MALAGLLRRLPTPSPNGSNQIKMSSRSFYVSAGRLCLLVIAKRPSQRPNVEGAVDRRHFICGDHLQFVLLECRQDLLLVSCSLSPLSASSHVWVADSVYNVQRWLVEDGKDCGTLVNLLQGLIPRIQQEQVPLDRMLMATYLIHARLGAWHLARSLLRVSH